MLITRQTINHESEAAWLADRARDVTSTELAALFGASPYATRFELHHIKAGTMEAKPFVETDRVKWGKRLEAAIAAGIAEDLGLLVVPFKVYMRIPELRMGSSFDFKIVGITDFHLGDESARDMFRKHGPGLMEIKNVDGMQFRRGWETDGETVEAPPHIELQVQHQMEVADIAWSLLAPLVGGNAPCPIIRERDPVVGEAVRLAVAEFWNGVDHGVAPAPDMLADSDTVKRLYAENDGSAIDLTDDMRLSVLCATYKAEAAKAGAAEGRKTAALTEIITKVGAAKTIQAPGFKINAGTNKESYRCYDRAEGVRWTITRSVVPAGRVEAEVPRHRNVTITGV